MYSVTVRDSMMIAHSLPHASFGPAQRLHGATYVVDAEFSTAELSAEHVVLDIGLAARALHDVLDELNYRNLDELPAFRNTITTTEYLARHIHDRLAQELAGQFAGNLRVTLHESHVAWAAYAGSVP